ncbi:hypothetical protein [Bradyrhizobium sp. CCBAU 45394]|uniref:hypothetical protein n=1 Tax=Bradyrhizobium sp. CCBAU 45394 TaxID=1325087 RepID=UPI00230472CF|nr:hypothetical protein [Bradyrhizobium sp. CCBAU 45394]
MFAEEVLSGVHDGTVAGVARNFRVDCPQHGRRIHQGMGHHSTVQEVELKGLFKKHRTELKAKLESSERTRFTRALEGKLRPEVHEVERWKRLLEAIVAA